MSAVLTIIATVAFILTVWSGIGGSPVYFAFLTITWLALIAKWRIANRRRSQGPDSPDLGG